MQKKKALNIKTVAEIANVSISTVSRVMNNSANVSDELRDKVYKAIDQTGYSANPIASNLKSARRDQVAIVIPSLRQTFYTDIIKGASDFLFNHQISPIILESSNRFEREKKLVDMIERQWLDGIILIPSKNYSVEGYKEFIESLSELKKSDISIPVVLTEYGNECKNLDCVSVDYGDAFYQMTYHLLEIGRRRLAYLSKPADAANYAVCLDAFQRAIDDFGEGVKEEAVEYAEYTILSGYEAMKKVLKRCPKVDGVVCSGDQVAAGALIACQESGIPLAERIAVIGYGGVAVSIITTPSITTMITPRYELGYESARAVYERLKGEREDRVEIFLKPHLAIRPSTLKSAKKTLDAMFSE